MITVEEINERLNFNNPEVKEYFKPFYDKLEKMDLEKPTPEDQIKLFYETIKVLDEEYYFNIFDFDYTPSDELTKTFHIWQNEGPLRIKLLNNLWIVLSLECRISRFFLY